MKQKKKNPIYVVNNKGKDVVAAKGWFDALIEKLDLGSAMKMFNQILEAIFSQMGSYAWFEAFKKFLDEFIERMEKFVAALQAKVTTA